MYLKPFAHRLWPGTAAQIFEIHIILTFWDFWYKIKLAKKLLCTFVYAKPPGLPSEGFLFG
nr:MAG TPA: hypothetical protein [Inoviridae sp.]